LPPFFCLLSEISTPMIEQYVYQKAGQE